MQRCNTKIVCRRTRQSVHSVWKHAAIQHEYCALQVQDKTKAKLAIYCPQRLQAYLASLPKTGRHILAKNLTEHIAKRAAQKAVEDVRRALDIINGPDRLVPHGWRYTAAVQLSDAGCSDDEVQAVTGHKTLEMVRKYRAQRNQRAASKRAQQKRER